MYNVEQIDVLIGQLEKGLKQLEAQKAQLEADEVRTLGGIEALQIIRGRLLESAPATDLVLEASSEAQEPSGTDLSPALLEQEE